MSPRRTVFDRFARWAEHQLGRSIAFALAVLSIVVWGVTGPLFGWSDTWQLVINTGTTIVTFLTVFVISERAKPRYAGAAAQTRRADPGQYGSAKFADGARREVGVGGREH